MLRKTATALFALLTAATLTACNSTGHTEKTASHTLDTIQTIPITDLIIDAQTSDVTISPSEDKKNHADLYTNKYATDRFSLDIKTNDTILTLKVTDKTNVKDSATLALKLPQKFYDKILLHTTFGNVTLQGTAAYQISLTTITGGINATDLRGHHVTFTTTSGDINIQNSISNTFRTATTSGNITISLDQLFPTLTADTIYGNVDLHLPPNTSFYIDAKAHLSKATTTSTSPVEAEQNIISAAPSTTASPTTATNTSNSTPGPGR